MDRSERVAIRVAATSDVEATVATHREAALTGFNGIFPPASPTPTAASLRPRWLELIRDPHIDVFVAEATDVVGCAVLRPDNDVPAGILLDRLYVHPRWWGHGIGRRLHDTALAAARNRGVDRLNLWVLEAHTKARAMYERWGWKLIPGWTLPNTPPSVLDVLYEKPLAQPEQKI